MRHVHLLFSYDIFYLSWDCGLEIPTAFSLSTEHSPSTFCKGTSLLFCIFLLGLFASIPAGAVYQQPSTKWRAKSFLQPWGRDISHSGCMNCSSSSVFQGKPSSFCSRMSLAANGGHTDLCCVSYYITLEENWICCKTYFFLDWSSIKWLIPSPHPWCFIYTHAERLLVHAVGDVLQG